MKTEAGRGRSSLQQNPQFKVPSSPQQTLGATPEKKKLKGEGSVANISNSSNTIILANQNNQYLNNKNIQTMQQPSNMFRDNDKYVPQASQQDSNSNNFAGPFEKSIINDHNYGIPAATGSLTLQQHLQGMPPESQLILQGKQMPEFNKSLNYHYEFWKMYYSNENILRKLVEFKNEIAIFRQRADQLEAMISNLDEEDAAGYDGQSGDSESNSGQNNNGHPNHNQKKKKKIRRTYDQIDKSFQCPYENCTKTYGSEVSLNLHIKIKHNGGNKTEREKLARQIFAAKSNGEQIPEMNLNLPPGFIDDISSGGPKSDYLKPKHNANLDKDKNSNQPSSSNHK